MADVSVNNERGKKRKKKRSHIQMAKKFARQRQHGTEVDSDTYQYMVRVLELLRNGFPNTEEKLLFANNVYEQTIGHELEYAKNQVGSRVLDSLLKYATLETIQRLVEAFTSSLRPLSSDRFASHVLQKIVLVCADRGNRRENGNDEEKKEEEFSVEPSEVKQYNDVAIKLCRYFINNMEEFVSDTYANHLLRTAIECLGGLISDPDGDGKKKLVLSDRRPVVKEYKNLLVQSCNRILKWPQFLEFGQNELTSALLQSVLYSLKDVNPELLDSFVKKITEECYKPGKNDKLSNIFDNASSVRLLEACLAMADAKTFEMIYKKYFAGNLKQLSLTSSTNFSVQRLLDHCSTKEDFELIFEEISVHFSEILGTGHTGVLASTGNACLRLQTKQGAFMNEILKMLHCESTQKQSHIVLCISTLMVQEHVENRIKRNSPKGTIHLHGSLIIQAMLNFNKPIKIVNSLLDMENDDLMHLFGDPKGSHVFDAFMSSKYVGEKSRDKLAKKLQGPWFAELAKTTHGSRCLDRLWTWSEKKQRISIVESLSAAGESLRSTKSGKLIWTKLNVELFIRSKKEWLESQGKEEKTKAMFANIIGDAVKKKK